MEPMLGAVDSVPGDCAFDHRGCVTLHPFVLPGVNIEHAIQLACIFHHGCNVELLATLLPARAVTKCCFSCAMLAGKDHVCRHSSKLCHS